MNFEREAKRIVTEHPTLWSAAIPSLAKELQAIFEEGKRTGRQEAIAELRKEYKDPPEPIQPIPQVVQREVKKK